jgi:transposase
MERKSYTKYSREFKLEAVRLAALGEKPQTQIARELGIRVNQFRKWRLAFEAEALRGASMSPAASQDVQALRRENARLRTENEILKKAAIFVSRRSA